MYNMMRNIKSVLAAGAIALVALLTGTGAQAASGESVYYWGANCVDCAATSGRDSFGVTGVLTLFDYTLGNAIAASNFVSFSYSGSNLVDPYTVLPIGDGMTPPNYAFGEHGFDPVDGMIAGEISVAPGANRFEIQFADGLFFETQADGTWSTCAPFGDEYSGGNSCFTFPPQMQLQHADMGNQAMFSTTPVPEASTWAMLSGGLVMLAWMRRRRT